MIRLLQSVHREEDGAVRFDDLAQLFKSKFEATSHWSIEASISFLAKGGGQKKRIQYCLTDDFAKYIYHVGNQGGLIQGGKSQEVQAVRVFSQP